MIGQITFSGDKLLGSKTSFRLNSDAKLISGILLHIPNIEILHEALPNPETYKDSVFLSSLAFNNGKDKVFADVPLIYFSFQSTVERQKKLPVSQMLMACNYKIISNAVHYIVLKPDRKFLQFINQNSSVVGAIESLNVNMYYKY
jgi:hypothetical protein